MLKLTNIVKNYLSGDETVAALKGVSIEFRKSEFVSILGPSGCGKTTLLNIIGGLDRYTTGDLEINGVSTTKFKDRDWDTYRNHSIGFVFQSYNLIPHQSILANVELALTLSGVSKAERRARAKKVLEQVGLKDQIKKRPNQLSGGQMQRVAIARALVNDPEILLADEPTGALDSATSVQIMDLLRAISKDRLIIMVTHNPELAEQYSTRIVRLLDGQIIGDSAPYDSSVAERETQKEKEAPKGRHKRTTMSFFTALSLSFKNLLTKKTRTFLTSFAGSIGIIGIALILSISSGFDAYISNLEKDTLSSYPIMIQEENVDLTDLMTAMAGKRHVDKSGRDKDHVYSNNMMTEMLNALSASAQKNNLAAFKKYIENGGIAPHLYSAIQYSYALPLNIYSSDLANGALQVNPSSLFSSMMGGGTTGIGGMGFTYNVWSEMIDNPTLLDSQYDVLDGHWPRAYNEVVLLVDKNNEISDVALYSLGLLDQSELREMMMAIQKGEEYETEIREYTYEELLNTTFKLILPTDYFTDEDGDGVWEDRSKDPTYLINLVSNAETLHVSGIIRQSEDASAASISGVIGYTSALTTHVANYTNNSAIVKQQKENSNTDVFTGLPFNTEEYVPTIEEFNAYIATLSEQEQFMIAQVIEGKSEEEILAMFASSMKPSESTATYEENLRTLGVVDLDSPSAIHIYPSDFSAKETISDIIAKYNKNAIDSGNETDTISYTDYIGIMLSSVSTAIDAISYVLIAFVAISLVVSSIMIGIITYISVLERTKEIGVLRSIGASKRDISRVFNAETLIIGFSAGAIGILATIVLDIPINLIIDSLTGIGKVAVLPWKGGVVLVLISMALTLISGLIPSRIAANKDPVVALRTE